MNSPLGLKTWLPSDVRKQERITDSLIELYESFAFEPIIIPTIVDLSVAGKANAKFSSNTFKLLDRDGNTLALRTELTQPIAKTIALRANDISLPIKLYYNSNIFRYKGIATDDSREIQQLGLEYFGAKESENFSDHEVVYLLIESALKLGLTKFKVPITHALIWQTILQNHPDAHLAYDAAATGDLVKLKELAKSNSIYELLLSTASVTELGSALGLDLSLLRSLLEEFPQLEFDPLLCPDLNLYTGIYFSLYNEGEGKFLAMGGRYDNLCKSFGAELPGIGFAYYVPRLLKVLLSAGLIADTAESSVLLRPKASWQETLKEIKKLIHTKKGAKLTSNVK